MIDLYVIRVLHIERHDDGTSSYHQMETNEKFGPFPTMEALVEHIHWKLLEQIEDEVEGRLH
jgi:hypothetical protein